jgi:hypothetical protein
MLRTAGWRVAIIEPGTPLAVAWQGLSRAGQLIAPAAKDAAAKDAAANVAAAAGSPA